LVLARRPADLIDWALSSDRAGAVPDLTFRAREARPAGQMILLNGAIRLVARGKDLPHMPNSGRCPSAYSCTTWHIPSRFYGAMIAELACVISL